MTLPAFRDPPNLELLSREQLIEVVRVSTSSLNRLREMILANHEMIERAASALRGLTDHAPVDTEAPTP